MFKFLAGVGVGVILTLMFYNVIIKWSGIIYDLIQSVAK